MSINIFKELKEFINAKIKYLKTEDNQFSFNIIY
jgi:hypothetical protein